MGGEGGATSGSLESVEMEMEIDIISDDSLHVRTQFIIQLSLEMEMDDSPSSHNFSNAPLESC
jgi:hypothetical protein